MKGAPLSFTLGIQNRANKLLPPHQIQVDQRKNWISRLLIFSLSLAFFPVIIFILGVLFGILFNCNLQAHSCTSLPNQLGEPFVMVLGLLLIFGSFGLQLTVPAGVTIFIIGIITNGISRKTKIKWVYAVLLLPLILVLISAVIWLYKSAM
ncbi:MAG: hypothetical protein ABL903_19675 [Methylococcales bacterium]